MSYDIINKKANYILVPFGTGELFENICNTMKKEVQNIGKDPRFKSSLEKIRKMNIIGSTVDRKNSKAKMFFSEFKPFTSFSEQWIRFYKKYEYIGTKSRVFIVKEKNLESSFELMNKQKIKCGYSSCVGLAYLLENKKSLPKNSKYLIINIGTGFS